jgi:hypothetical protein
MQAVIWYRQGRLGDAISEASRALETFEKLGATNDSERCRDLLQKIEQKMVGKLLEMMLLLWLLTSLLLAHHPPSNTPVTPISPRSP